MTTFFFFKETVLIVRKYITKVSRHKVPCNDLEKLLYICTIMTYDGAAS